MDTRDDLTEGGEKFETRLSTLGVRVDKMAEFFEDVHLRRFLGSHLDEDGAVVREGRVFFLQTT